VVQGSVLGPWASSVLLIYDIASKISHCRYHLYADVQLYRSGDIDSISDRLNRINLDLERLHK
jgi:hypothetical protein